MPFIVNGHKIFKFFLLILTFTFNANKIVIIIIIFLSGWDAWILLYLLLSNKNIVSNIGHKKTTCSFSMPQRI